MNNRTLVAILLTSILTASLFAAGPAAAREVSARLGITTATSTTTIPLQVRLSSSSGTPINGLKTLTFKLYSVPTGGSALWTETWTAGNAVQVTDGVASVLLGSQAALAQSLVAANSSLYLGITVDVEAEMQPRIQLGSTPIAMTVPDGALSPRKLAAQIYTASDNVPIAISTNATWYDLAPLSVTIPAPDVPIATRALVLFDARCKPTVGSPMAILFEALLDGSSSGYTDAYPTAGQMLNFSFHNIVMLAPNASHTIKMRWQFLWTVGTAECSERRLSVILLGQ